MSDEIRHVSARQVKDQLHDGGEIALLDAREEAVFGRRHLLMASCVPLKRDYSAAFQHFEAARYAYLIDQKATAGWRADTSGIGSEGDLPLVDLYLALIRRFDEQAKHRRQHGIRDDHWSTLMMLSRELPDKPDIVRIRSAMYPLVPQIEVALEQLEEFIHEAQVAFKKAASTGDPASF